MFKRKKFNDLTIRDNFMFCAVMGKEKNCKQFLEMVLDVEIASLTIDTEKSMQYHSEYRGIRMDVLAKDAEQTHYNVEMQLTSTETELRSRYYHSQMDMDLLKSGINYSQLPDTYVIFICDYDPLGLGLYRYTIKNYCEEMPDFPYKAGQHTILLSTKGMNDADVPAEIISFLKYVGNPNTKEYTAISDSFVGLLEKSISEIKQDRNLEGRYMTFGDLLDQERAEGKQEGIFQILVSLVSDQVITVSEAATRAGMSEDEFKKLMK